MRLTLVLLLAGLGIAVIVFVATSGHVILLPILLILPLGLLGLRRGR
jgi:hypothetical protein